MFKVYRGKQGRIHQIKTVVDTMAHGDFNTRWYFVTDFQRRKDGRVDAIIHPVTGPYNEANESRIWAALLRIVPMS
jgi:hypothetical protein